MPFYIILVSAAIAEIKAGFLKKLCLIAIIMLNLIQLYHYYYDIKNNKNTWRNLGTYLEEKVNPDDAILIVPKFNWIVLSYYFKKDNEVFGFITVDQKELDSIKQLHTQRDVWVINYPVGLRLDLYNFFDQWLRATAIGTDFPNLYFLEKE